MAAADQGQKPVNVAELLFKAAFDVPRDPRSAEYKEGVRACLAYRVTGARLRSPYPMGTVQADAFYAGVDEGNQLWRAHRELEKRSRPPFGGSKPSASGND